MRRGAGSTDRSAKIGVVQFGSPLVVGWGADSHCVDNGNRCGSGYVITVLHVEF
jgi:hypothetical protein